MICPGRHTLTRLWASIPTAGRRSYHAYSRLVRQGRWCPEGIFQRLLGAMVEQLAPAGRLVLLVDDTRVRKSGRKINGVGIFRDVVGSALSTKLVTALGLNVVVSEPAGAATLARRTAGAAGGSASTPQARSHADRSGRGDDAASSRVAPAAGVLAGR